MKKRYMELLMAVLMLVSVFFLSREGARLVSQQRDQKIHVVLDAGHGGDDPGKIGTAKTKEKDLNLNITKKVQKLLEKEGVTVHLTRESDKGLYDADGRNKKVQDLQRRCDMIHRIAPDCVVSIHQNSYPDPAVKGAQVFYYTDSKEGESLAGHLQNALVKYADTSNHRQSKGNKTYYLLKKTDVPLAIVECGFLSCPEEESLLKTEEYQDKIAHAICQGILEYIEMK